MIRIIDLMMRSGSNGVAFQGRTFVVGKSSNKRGEFFQNKPKYLLNHKDA